MRVINIEEFTKRIYKILEDSGMCCYAGEVEDYLIYENVVLRIIIELEKMSEDKIVS